MDNMEKLVLGALKNKAPELLKDLKEGFEEALEGLAASKQIPW